MIYIDNKPLADIPNSNTAKKFYKEKVAEIIKDNEGAFPLKIILSEEANPKDNLNPDVPYASSKALISLNIKAIVPVKKEKHEFVYASAQTKKDNGTFVYGPSRVFFAKSDTIEKRDEEKLFFYFYMVPQFKDSWNENLPFADKDICVDNPIKKAVDKSKLKSLISRASRLIWDFNDLGVSEKDYRLIATKSGVTNAYSDDEEDSSVDHISIVQSNLDAKILSKTSNGKYNVSAIEKFLSEFESKKATGFVQSVKDLVEEKVITKKDKSWIAVVGEGDSSIELPIVNFSSQSSAFDTLISKLQEDQPLYAKIMLYAEALKA